MRKKPSWCIVMSQRARTRLAYFLFCRKEDTKPSNVYWLLLNICKQVEMIYTREVKENRLRKKKTFHGIVVNVCKFYFTVKMKINATELKNFSISESKFKSQTKQRCITALQKYTPKMQLLLGLYSKHYYALLCCKKKKKSTEKSILAVIFCRIFFRYYF